MFTRLQAAFAGMLDHADQHIGAADRLPGGRRPARQHAGPGAVRQRRQPGGRAARHRQRDGALQLQARADGREAAADRRHRRAGHTFQLSARLGDGLEHAAAPLQAEHPWRRHPRSAGDELAEGHRRARRAAPSVLPCQRPGADPAGAVGDRAAGRDQRRGADADRRRELRRQPARCRGSAAQGAAVLRDVRPSRPVAGRLEGGRLPSAGHALRERPLGAVPSRPRLLRESTTSRPSSPSG